MVAAGRKGANPGMSSSRTSSRSVILSSLGFSLLCIGEVGVVSDLGANYSCRTRSGDWVYGLIILFVESLGNMPGSRETWPTNMVKKPVDRYQQDNKQSWHPHQVAGQRRYFTITEAV